ncbi:MAG: hypothetical protein RLZZ490_1681, partial [Cyanobacteriota bacterium]
MSGLVGAGGSVLGVNRGVVIIHS